MCAKEPYISATEHYVSAKEPFNVTHGVFPRNCCADVMCAKEPYISAEEPYISAREPYISAK